MAQDAQYERIKEVRHNQRGTRTAHPPVAGDPSYVHFLSPTPTTVRSTRCWRRTRRRE